LHRAATKVSVLLEDPGDPKEFTRRYNQAAGPCVAAICQDRDLTQEETAALLGVSTRQIRRMERGEVAYTLPQLELIAHKTKTTAAAILDLIAHWPVNTRTAGAPRKGRKKKR
jgi:transcriptional regulator with XRE-family HTH domain